MKHHILEERDELYLVQSEENGVSTLPKNDYFVLKLKHFDGNRIFYDFEDETGGNAVRKVEETYNDGIFNCYCDDEMIQIADSQGISRAIIDKDGNEFDSIFARWYGIKSQHNMINIMLHQYKHRFEFDEANNMYIVDDMFCVDMHGVAKQKKEKSFSPVCIVVNSAVKPKIIRLPGIRKPVVVNEITQTMIAKMLFLMFPKKDNVFLEQLTQHAKSHVMRLITLGYEGQMKTRDDMTDA